MSKLGPVLVLFWCTSLAHQNFHTIASNRRQHLPTRVRLARHNAALCSVTDCIEFSLTDLVNFSRSYIARKSREAEGYKHLRRLWMRQFPKHPHPTPRNTLATQYSLPAIQPLLFKQLFGLARLT
ncbi:hypothetical protein OE88DRAFT_520761 [Heliocybe sulcata]|uniref:Secreted protein n=1 Tax=Heliocybe sulcata TaxID=5364 RepID=A0A5C3MSL4_9AGAM|nr:hypothetical protein OE88DRAFT_520761 [Heliocybe sulcata]